MSEPFKTLVRDAYPFGVLVAVELPDVREGVHEEALRQLHPGERAVAEHMHGHRQVSWVGGRLAIRRALKILGQKSPAVIGGPHGEPVLPGGFTGSISHKKDMAIALVARAVNGTVGVDLEIPSSTPRNVGEKVLRTEELEWVNSLPQERHWPATLVLFSMKEAIYKALFPHVKRYVGFHEASVKLDVNGPSEVTLFLEGDEGPFSAEARVHWIGDRVVSTARVLRAK